MNPCNSNPCYSRVTCWHYWVQSANDHSWSLLIHWDGHCFILCSLETDWHRELLAEGLSRSVLGGILVRKSGRQGWAEGAADLQWDCNRHQLCEAWTALVSTFGVFPNWSKGIGPLYPFSCQLFVEEMIPGKGIEASAKQPIVWVELPVRDTAVVGQYLILPTAGD